MLQRVKSRFCIESFLSHSAGKVRREPFCDVFQKNAGCEKFLDKKGGSIKILRRTFFCLTVPKNVIGEHFIGSLNSGIEIFYASEGYVTIFRGKFYVSQ